MKQSKNYYEPIKQQQLRRLVLVVAAALALFSDRLLLGCRSQPLGSGDAIENNQQQQQQQQQHQTAEQLQSQDYLNYAKQRSPFMQVHKLPAGGNNQHITCNDGSQIGYYKRLNQHSKSWVIYLQGGGFCGTRESCRHRWQRSPHLMSSRFWPKTKIVDGILSSDPRENPYLWNANHIYVPYCSSDSWTGSAVASSSSEQQQRQQQPRHEEPRPAGEFMAGAGTPSSFAFMGSQILARVFESLYEDLPARQSLYDAKFILLAGDSAGATGVIMNLDRMSALVAGRAQQLRANCTEQLQQQATVCDPKRADPMLRGLADSGWFLDNEPYNFELDQFGGEPSTGVGVSAAATATAAVSQRPAAAAAEDSECEQGRCTPSQSIRQAMRLWNGQAPEACARRHPAEPWRCYFGYRAYQSLRTPLFVVQWLYDEAQLMVDNIVRPGTSGQWNYVHKVVNEMRASLENVTALFAPSCLSHSLIARKSWNQVNINGFKLPHILNSWEEQPLLDSNASGGNSAISSMMSGSNTVPTRQQQQQQQQSSSSSSESGNQQQQQQQQQQTGDRVADTLAGIVGGPASFETVLGLEVGSSNGNSNSNSNDQHQHQHHHHNMAALYLRSAERLTLSQESRNQIGSKPSMAPTVAAAVANSANGQQAAPKSRSRKRKRNNQQQQQQQQQQQNRIKQSRQRANKPPPPPQQQQQQQQLQQLQQSQFQMQPLNEQLDQSSGAAAAAATATITSQSRDANDLNHQPPSPMQDLLPLSIDRSPLGSSLSSDLLYGQLGRADQTAGAGSTVRLGRSTFVEDGSLVLGNNVPDDGASSRLAQMTAGAGAGIGLLGEQPSETRSASTASTIATSGSTFSPDQFRFIDTCGWPQCNRDCPVLDFEFSSAVSFQF